MNINAEWRQLLSSILQMGQEVKPRDLVTREIIGYTSIVDMSRPIVSHPMRKINYNFLCGEAHWILSGSNRLSEIKPFMNAIERFSDNGITFRGAYGPKVIEQLDYVVESLKSDPFSRQAVLTIWRENPMPSKDIPCTVAMQFMIRDLELHCNVFMRSSDAWLGWVYDVFNFSMISTWIAIALQDAYPGVKLGKLKLMVGSQHLYAEHFDKAWDIIHSDIPDSVQMIDPYWYNEPDELLIDLYDVGTDITKGSNSFFNQIGRLRDEQTKP